MSAKKDPSAKILTPANVVTIFRIAAVIPFLIFLGVIRSNPEGSLINDWIVVVLFIAISFSDKLDGYLARSRNEVTNFGKFLDPIADKLFLGGILIVLSFVTPNLFPWIPALIILIREISITIFRSLIVKKRNIVIPASNLGKFKTVVQIVALGFFVAPLELLHPFFTYFGDIALAIALILTIVSGIQYIFEAYKK